MVMTTFHKAFLFDRPLIDGRHIAIGRHKIKGKSHAPAFDFIIGIIMKYEGMVPKA